MKLPKPITVLQFAGAAGAAASILAAFLGGAVQEVLATFDFLLLAIGAVAGLIDAAETHAD